MAVADQVSLGAVKITGTGPAGPEANDVTEPAGPTPISIVCAPAAAAVIPKTAEITPERYFVRMVNPRPTYG